VSLSYPVCSHVCLLAAQKRLRDLKARISAQSKKNFVLERDVRYLDSRIALLIQNRMALDEVSSLSLPLHSIMRPQWRYYCRQLSLPPPIRLHAAKRS
jgi:hypothetical protein